MSATAISPHLRPLSGERWCPLMCDWASFTTKNFSHECLSGSKSRESQGFVCNEEFGLVLLSSLLLFYSNSCSPVSG